MTQNIHIVCTTIFEPKWLSGYLDNIEKHGHKSDVQITIIGDRKTPASVFAASQEARQRGFRIDCPDLDEQVEYLRRLGVDDQLIPWNTDNRRNIGFLKAIEAGADVLISIDDDNYCPDDEDFVAAHCCVGGVVGDSAGLMARGGDWYNICERMASSSASPIYPRGFPYASRNDQVAALASMGADELGRLVSINAGLWTYDPDVDALTRLAIRPRVGTAEREGVILSPETWSPINTQNTALTRAAVPAYYYVRMGFDLGGMKIDRFGDILSGYFVQKCAKHLGHAVRIGSPVAAHIRTPHNLIKDLYHELAGIALIEDLLPWLQETRLDGSSYADSYASLADALSGAADQFTGFVWDDGGREFLRETADCMRSWLRVVNGLNGG